MAADQVSSSNCSSILKFFSKMNFRKKEITEAILLKGCFNIINSDNISQCDEELVTTIEHFAIVNGFRYLDKRSWTVPKSLEWYLKILPSYDDIRFKSCLRVSRNQFQDILITLYESDIFKQQTFRFTIELQLAVALYRFGNDGSGVSFRRIGQIFGISDAGAVRACTDRVIKALLSCQKSIIKWPEPDERKEICQMMLNELPGCIGYVDGCHVPLFQAPLEDHEAYYSRKQQYAIHLQTICDNFLVFRNVSIGYPACAHDARVFVNSPIGQDPEKFLDEGQWIAGDSAYRLTRYLVTPFRDNATVGTAAQRRGFNKHFSSHRVKIEQAFGILKNIFGSLRSLRIRVDKNGGHQRACEWIVACIVLYNIIKPSDEMCDADFHEDEDANNLEIHATNQGDSAQRDYVFNWFLTNKYQ